MFKLDLELDVIGNVLVRMAKQLDRRAQFTIGTVPRSVPRAMRFLAVPEQPLN